MYDTKRSVPDAQVQCKPVQVPTPGLKQSLACDLLLAMLYYAAQRVEQELIVHVRVSVRQKVQHGGNLEALAVSGSQKNVVQRNDSFQNERLVVAGTKKMGLPMHY